MHGRARWGGLSLVLVVLTGCAHVDPLHSGPVRQVQPVRGVQTPPSPARPMVQVRIPEQISVETPNDYLEPGTIISFDQRVLKVEGFADACFPASQYQPKEGNVHSWRGRTVYANGSLFDLATESIASIGLDLKKHRGSVASVEMSGAKQRLFSGAEIELALERALDDQAPATTSRDLCRTALRRGEAIIDSVYVAESATFYFHKSKTLKGRVFAGLPTAGGQLDRRKAVESEHELSFDKPLVVGYTIRPYQRIYSDSTVGTLARCESEVDGRCLVRVVLPNR